MNLQWAMELFVRIKDVAIGLDSISMTRKRKALHAPSASVINTDDDDNS